MVRNIGCLISILATVALAGSALAQAKNSALTHCQSDERIQFSCRIGAKVVSLCGGGTDGPLSSLTYRYGASRKIEKEYAARPDNANRFFGTIEPLNPRAVVEQIWFDQGKVRYLMTVCTGGNCPQHAGLAVLRRNRIIMNTPCVPFVDDDRGWFSSDLGTFSSQAANSQSSTGLLVMEDVGGNELHKLFPHRGPPLW